MIDKFSISHEITEMVWSEDIPYLLATEKVLERNLIDMEDAPSVLTDGIIAKIADEARRENLLKYDDAVLEESMFT